MMSHPDEHAAQHDPMPPANIEPKDAKVFELLYAELRHLAQSALSGERRSHTLSATALVNEAFLKLAADKDGDKPAKLANLERGRLFALAAVAMRHILVDYARMRNRDKRGGGALLLDSSAAANAPAEGAEHPLDALILDEALTRLAKEHPEAAKVVEMRFFGGLPEATIASAMDLSERTVRRHWTFAKAWLARELGDELRDNA